jgi:hypothetical protein
LGLENKIAILGKRIVFQQLSHPEMDQVYLLQDNAQAQVQGDPVTLSSNKKELSKLPVVHLLSTQAKE